MDGFSLRNASGLSRNGIAQSPGEPRIFIQLLTTNVRSDRFVHLPDHCLFCPRGILALDGWFGIKSCTNIDPTVFCIHSSLDRLLDADSFMSVYPSRSLSNFTKGTMSFTFGATPRDLQ